MRRDDVDAGEGEGLKVRRRAHDFLLLQDLAAAKEVAAVEQQLAGAFAALDRQSGERLFFIVKIEHAAKIDSADYIHVVENERFLCKRTILEKEPGCFFQAAAGFKQLLFAGYFDVQAEIIVGFEVIHDHVREMVDVDDDFANAEGAQTRKSDFEQGAASNFHKGLGASVGDRAEARAEARRKNHGFHCGAPSRVATWTEWLRKAGERLFFRG